MKQSQSNPFCFDIGVVLALAIALIIRPVLYTLLTPALFHGLTDDSGGRSSWWWFYTWILFWEWIPFLVVWLALHRRGRQWQDLGVDWSFFKRYGGLFLAAMIGALIIAFIAPHYLYQGNIPSSSRSGAILPVTGLERAFFLGAAVSAGICEEICYRGLPLRLFAGSMIKAWAILPVTMVAFVFIHGLFGASHLSFYLLIGLGYGGIFILLGRRRLEWLIVAHALYDALIILAP